MKARYIVALGALVAAAVLLYRTTAGGAGATAAEGTVAPSAEPARRAPEERTLRRLSFEIDAPLHGYRDSVYAAGVLKRTPRGTLIFADFGDARVKEVTPDGRFVRAYGYGQGAAPGELRGIVDFDVVLDSLYVLDVQSRSVSVFDARGVFARRFVTTPPGMRLVLHGEALSVLSPVPGEMFGLYDARTGRALRRYGDVLARPEAFASAVNAELVRVPEGTKGVLSGAAFIYVPDDADLLFAFDDAGRMRHVFETVGRRGFTAPATSPAGSAVAPESPVMTTGATFCAGQLRLHTVVRSVRDALTGEVLQPAQGFVDIYDLESLAYAFSVRTPEVMQHGRMCGGKLTGLSWSGDRILSYRYTGLP